MTLEAFHEHFNAQISDWQIVNFIHQSRIMNLATAPNVVFHYLPYFSSPFANFQKD